MFMRKRLVLVGLVFLVIALGSGGWLWWSLGPGAPSELTPTALPPVPPLSPSSAATPPPAPELPSPAKPSDALQTLSIGPIDHGTFIIEARGQRLGTESYTLERRENGDLYLQSNGTLHFKIAFFNIQASFVQVMTFTAQRRPTSYQLALSGPIGIGNRKVSASFGASGGMVDDGQHQIEIALPEEPFLLLGMFSSYAILPLWAQLEQSQKLKVISLRGDRRDGDPEVWVLLEYVDRVQLRPVGAQADSQSLDAEEYFLKNEHLTVRLYLSGERLLGLENDRAERDESFRLYRSDLFPQGFEVLSARN
jgi:hypothetical protein